MIEEMTRLNRMEVLEAQEHEVYMAYVAAIGTDAEEALREQHEAICAELDRLDGTAEETSSAYHPDEWMLDNAEMAYEI